MSIHCWTRTADNKVTMSANRYPTKEKAAIEVYGRGENFIADVRNLSVTGALLEWPHRDIALQKGDLVRITVILRALRRRHYLNAEVVWTEGGKSGVNFIKADQVLEKLMEKNG